MRKYLAVFLVAISFDCMATEQIKDVLYIERASYTISELPLDQLYNQDDLSSILKPQLCSASWRGYKASWELRDGFLWLRGIQKNPCGDDYQSVGSNLLFKGKHYPVKADWYTGKIVLPVAEEKPVMRQGFDKENAKTGDYLGYDLEAYVFNFVNGQLKSKGEELIQIRY